MESVMYVIYFFMGVVVYVIICEMIMALIDPDEDLIRPKTYIRNETLNKIFNFFNWIFYPYYFWLHIKNGRKKCQ